MKVKKKIPRVTIRKLMIMGRSKMQMLTRPGNMIGKRELCSQRAVSSLCKVSLVFQAINQVVSKTRRQASALSG